MLMRLEAEAEPPSTATSDDAACLAMVERVMAIAHMPATAHVTVIGRHTLPFILALMRRGCTSVRSLRPDAPSPDCEAADLAWIVDIGSEQELNEALKAAWSRSGTTGRVVLEGSACRWRNGLVAIRDRVLAAGLDIVSFDHGVCRLLLAPASRLTMAA